MNTKKLTIIVIMLMIIYFGIQFSLIYFSHGHHVNYNIKDQEKITVDETYIRRTKNEKDSYMLKFQVKDLIYSLQIFSDFKKNNYIVKDIKYYADDNYTCIYPIFKDKIKRTDFICYDGEKYINYSNIKSLDEELDKYVNSIEEYKEIKNESSIKKSGKLKLYRDNIIKNHNIVLENYKGVYLIKKDSVKNVKLFNKDVYTKDIHTVSSNYYLVADYNEKYTFNNIYLIDIRDGKKSIIKNNKDISLDGYIMGTVDNDVYLFDKSNKRQYKIMLDIKDISLIGKNTLFIYEDNIWKEVNVHKASEEKIKIVNYKIDEKLEKKYEQIDKIGGEKTGYYYLYEKTKEGYDVYRTNSQTIEQKLYIVTIDDTSNVFYIDDYFYFTKGNKILYYSDQTGIKTVIEYNELKYNDSLIFGVES